MIAEIYKELDSCANAIRVKCDTLKLLVEQQKGLSTTNFKNNKAFALHLDSIKTNLSLLQNFCALWNISSNTTLTTFYDTIQSAIKQYRLRKGDPRYPFTNITQQLLYEGIRISKKNDAETDAIQQDDRQEKIDCTISLFGNMRSNMLSLVPYILIDNATQYAETNTDIIVKLNYIDEQTGSFVVENYGPVIEDKDAIFQKNSRGRYAQIVQPHLGCGNGLYFAKQILVAHGCDITVEQDEAEYQVVNNIEYKRTRFIAYLQVSQINKYHNSFDEQEYFSLIFAHEFFNVKALLGKPFFVIRDFFDKHRESVGITEKDVDVLKPEFEKLELLKVRFLFVLSKYAYRNDVAIPDNRLDDKIYWTKEYQEAARLYQQEIASIGIFIDAKVEVSRRFLPNNQYRLKDFLDETPVQNLEIVKDIPLLIYNLFIHVASRNVRITLSPSYFQGYYMWHNTIELEVFATNRINEINNAIANINERNRINSTVELLIRMLNKYLLKICSKLEMTWRNNMLIIRFPIQSDIR